MPIRLLLLSSLLHESTRKPEYQPDWPSRLSIAIGVAEGLAFLHHVAIIHLDISSGNVLLDANSKPVVAEIEISKLLDPTKGTASISAVAGSFGYIPPGILLSGMQFFHLLILFFLLTFVVNILYTII